MPSPPIGTPQVPQNQQKTVGDNTVKRSKIESRLTPDQRKWSDNVLKALKLPSKGSQANILAGAISSAQVIASSNRPQPVKVQAGKLLKTVMDAGSPPWKDLKKAEKATAAKVQLDILSLPNPVLTPLNGVGNVNSAYWITRQDADGQERASFLCKPVNPVSNVDGVPPGGEVMREAISGRAAQHLSSLAKIDIGMPESHMIELDTNVLPPPHNVGGNVLTSVQEARPSIGSFESRPDLKANVSREQAAGLVIFDMMTLNVDRHHNNVLLDAQNNMIPIDHGGSFPDVTEPGALKRVRTAIGSRHNVLLKLPNAHEPLTDEMAKNLDKMSSTDYGKGLREDRDRLAGLHQGQDGMMTDGAIDAAQRAARFVKLGARIDPRMSPAAIQSALASAAHLLDPTTVSDRDFERQANELLQGFAERQAVVKQVCCSSDADYLALAKEVEALGWYAVPPGSPGDAPGISDPLVMLSIVQNRLRPGQGVSKREPPQTARTNMGDEATLLTTLAAVRLRAATGYLAYVDPGQLAVLTQAVNAVANLPANQQLDAYSQVIDQIVAAAKQYQHQRWNQLLQAYVIPAQTGPGDFFLIGDANSDLAQMAGAVDQMMHSCQVQNQYPPRQNAQPNNPPPQNPPPPPPGNPPPQNPPPPPPGNPPPQNPPPPPPGNPPPQNPPPPPGNPPPQNPLPPPPGNPPPNRPPPPPPRRN